MPYALCLNIQVGMWEAALKEKEEAIETLNLLVANMTAQKAQLASALAERTLRCTTYKDLLRYDRHTARLAGARRRHKAQRASALSERTLRCKT
jgi:hypothetical protein